MDGRKADVVFADPPYNVPIEGNVCGKGSIHHREFSMASGEMSEAEFSDFLCRALLLLERHSRDGSVHSLCMDWRHVAEVLLAGKKAYGTLLNLCVWAKTSAGTTTLGAGLQAACAGGGLSPRRRCSFAV